MHFIFYFIFMFSSFIQNLKNIYFLLFVIILVHCYLGMLIMVVSYNNLWRALPQTRPVITTIPTHLSTTLLVGKIKMKAKTCNSWEKYLYKYLRCLKLI